MKFGDIPIDDAHDCILAHTLRVNGSVFKKGTRLDVQAIELLKAGAVETVMAACPEAGDVLEDAAAARIAAAISAEQTHVAPAFTGRANIYADQAGIFVTTEDRIKDLNRVDEAITIATLSPYARVRQGQMVATVKIIPFSVADSKVRELEQIAGATAPDISVAPFRPLKIGLILTRLAGDAEKLIAKRQRAMAERIASLGGELSHTGQCDHSTDAVAKALSEMRANHDLILVFGASAIVDRADVVPTALTRAGGEILHLGMPVDPGNLLLYGKISEVPVIGVPSCAASIKINGFDWVLERLFAGLPLSRDDFISMAAGGLLKEILSRPQPREQADSRSD